MKMAELFVLGSRDLSIKLNSLAEIKEEHSS